MAIGFRELIVLMMLSGIPLLLIGVVVWLAVRSKRPRPVADRLAELESLRRAGTINTDEYERQRAAILASV
jgi:hypothetical protein